MKKLIILCLALLTLEILPVHAVVVMRTTPSIVFYTGGGYRCYPSGWCGRVTPGFYRGHKVGWYSYHKFYNPKFSNGTYIYGHVSPKMPVKLKTRTTEAKPSTGT